MNSKIQKVSIGFKVGLIRVEITIIKYDIESNSQESRGEDRMIPVLNVQQNTPSSI